MDYVAIQDQRLVTNVGKRDKLDESAVEVMAVSDGDYVKINVEINVHYVDYGKVVKHAYGELAVEMNVHSKGNANSEIMPVLVVQLNDYVV